jgi:hypothetical protein
MHILLTILILFQTSSNFALAKKENFKKIKAISSKKTDVFNHDININRTVFDKEIDDMIFDRLGADYRRANVYDFYPMEVKEKLDPEEEKKMMEYYDFARKGLERITKSKLTKVIKLDFNLDGKYDYAVIVQNTKKGQPYLAIINSQNTHYLEPCSEDFLELINNGSFPATIITTNDKEKTIASPVLRLFSFAEQKGQAFYYDRTKAKWKREALRL